ncbi:MAG: hypothetical protein ACRCXT_17450 [Paraclostridium sp.]
MISEKNYDISFSPSKVFMSDNPIRSKLYCRVFIDKIGEGTWEVVNENEYDVINDSIVFSEFPIGKFLSMQVSTTPAELMQSPTENTIIVSIKNEIKEVADVASSIITVTDNITKVQTVTDNITKVQTVSDNITNVNNVGNSITKVDTVADNIIKVNTVSDNIIKVNTVSDSITNVNLVGNNILDVNTVGNNITKVQIVSDDIVNVDVVANNITKVNTVSSGINKVIILADNIIDVDVVASNILDIQTVADNVVDIQNAEENANSALLSKNLAEKWASELEDVPVSDGKYSAYHWALKAFDLVSNGIIDDTTPSSIKTYSSNKIETIMNDLDLSNIDETVTLKHFTDTLLDKLNGIAEGATNYTHPASHPASMIDESVARRFVSDTEKSTWNGKQDVLVSGTNIKTINSLPLIGSGDLLFVDTVSNQIINGTKTFTISPTAPTPSAQDNSTKLATTAYVDGKMVLGTAVNSTSGTSIDFTGIPSWAKKIKILFNKVSTNGASNMQIQIGGSGGIENSGYSSSSAIVGATNSAIGVTSLTGFVSFNNNTANIYNGIYELINISGNIWILSGVIGIEAISYVVINGGTKTLSGSLDRIRITTVNGTDTFDAGQINIMYEG